MWSEVVDARSRCLALATWQAGSASFELRPKRLRCWVLRTRFNIVNEDEEYSTARVYRGTLGEHGGCWNDSSCWSTVEDESMPDLSPHSERHESLCLNSIYIYFSHSK